MSMPGFAAQVSLYQSSGHYRSTTMQGIGIDSIALAGTCTCSDPGCTWSCPAPPPPDDCNRQCGHLTGCARNRCFCEADACGNGICHGSCCQTCE